MLGHVGRNRVLDEVGRRACAASFGGLRVREVGKLESTEQRGVATDRHVKTKPETQRRHNRPAGLGGRASTTSRPHQRGGNDLAAAKRQ
jgi:hypothetical protein